MAVTVVKTICTCMLMAVTQAVQVPLVETEVSGAGRCFRRGY